MKFLQINDPHVSDQPPRMRTGSYREDILAKLQAALEIGAAHDVDAVVITGDLFHRKQPHHTSHRTVQDVRAVLRECGLPVYIVPGNHDLASDGTLVGQPLLSVLGENIQLLDGQAADNPLIYGIPWHNAMEGPEGAQWIANEVAESNASLVFMHAPLTPAPYPFGPTALGWIEIAALAPLLPSSVRVVGHGHIHKGSHLVVRT